MKVTDARVPEVRVEGRLFRVVSRCLVLSLVVAGLACGGAPKRSPETEVATKVRMAQAYYRGGRVADAIDLMKETIRMDPVNAGLHNFYGQLCLVSGRHAEAERAFKNALEKDPYFTDAHNNLGILYDEIGREAEAESEYVKALEDPAYPTPEKVYLNLGVLYASQGRDDEAIKALRRAVEISPQYLKAHYELAGLLDRNGSLEEAAREYEVAAPAYRSSGEFHYRLGLVYHRLGNSVDAADHLRRVLDVSPGSEQAARADELRKTIQ